MPSRFFQRVAGRPIFFWRGSESFILPQPVSQHPFILEERRIIILAQNNFLPLEQFTFVVTPPETRSSILLATLYTDGRFRLNGKLSQKVAGKPIRITFTEDAKHFCLMESADPAILFPKNGCKILQTAIDYVTQNRIPLPAKYLVRYNEEHGTWQGDLIENPTRAQGHRGTGSKRRS